MAAEDKKRRSGAGSASQQNSNSCIDEFGAAETTATTYKKTEAKQTFDKLRQSADAVDRVLMEDGDPELDWASG
jgi:hypothetical protein